MFRLITAILATGATVIFIMANTHEVELSFVFGSPVNVRMIFLLMATFILGLVTSSLWGLISRVKWRRRIRNEIRHEQMQPVTEPVPQ